MGKAWGTIYLIMYMGMCSLHGVTGVTGWCSDL